MKDFIFIIGPSAVGKTTLAKRLQEHYQGVYIEQSMVPEFSIPKNVQDVGVYEEKLCWENTLMQIEWFRNKGYKNIIALDFDDLRTRELPQIFKGTNFITLKLITSNFNQLKNQMEKRHKEGYGLYVEDYDNKSNDRIANRPLLPNEYIIDVNGKNADDVFNEAIKVIDNAKILKDYDYTLPDKSLFESWVKSNNLSLK